MRNVEWIGFCASVIILTSICFKTTSKKGRLRLRCLNTIGSAIFTLYGLLIKSYSLVFLNSMAVLVNIVNMIRETQLKDN